MYKLVAIDLDGTLLDSYGDISDGNRQAMKIAQDKGVNVVLCSGRITASVLGIANDIR